MAKGQIRFFYFADSNAYNSFTSTSGFNEDYLYVVGEQGLIYKGNQLIAQSGTAIFSAVTEAVTAMQAEIEANEGRIGVLEGKINTTIPSQLNNKVDKEDGKGLSEANFTQAEKEKLAGIEAGANNFSITIDNILSTTSTNPVQNKVIKEALDTKASTNLKINNHALTNSFNLTAEEVGADPEGTASAAIKAHNEDSAAHNSIQSKVNANTDNISKVSENLTIHIDNENVHLTDTDKNKINQAYAYSQKGHAEKSFSNVQIGTTVLSAESGTDTLILQAGDGVTLSADASTDTVTISSLDGVRSVTTGTKNGTISVDGNDVKVKGLTSMAYEDATTFTNNLKTAVKADVNTNLVEPHTSNTTIHVNEVDRAKWNDTATNLSTHTGNTSNPHGINKTQIGLGNVENKSSATIRGEITKANVTTALGYTPYTQAEVNTLLGGKANSSHQQAASTITVDPLEYYTSSDVQSALKAMETDIQTNKIGLNSKVPTSRKINGKSLSSDITLSASDVGASAEGHTHSNYVNQKAFSNVKVGSTTIAAETTTDTLEIAGSNVTITPDATNDKVTISVASGSTSAKGLVQLTNSTSSTSTTTAATPSSVKSAYDLANTAKTRADSAYTLAESKAVIKTLTSEDLDDVVKEGFYNAGDGNTVTNKPSGIDNFGLYVIHRASGAHYTQILIGNNTKSYRRHCENGTWSSWSEDKLTDTTYTLSSFGVTATAAELNKLDGVTATATELNYMDGVTSSVQAQLNGKSASGHTHNYAGSSSAGGAATSANKLNTNAGNSTTPVYFEGGVPKALSYTIAKSVPSDAKFTDTNTHYASSTVTAGSATGTSNSTTALTNGNVYLNHIENSGVKSSHKISGSGATTVTADTSGNITIKSTNTTYNVATAEANGLMSKEDFSKLEGIEVGANNYTLPTATNTGILGGVKTTSTVTSASGHTPTPIINGVPYYKDTNTTYTGSNGITLTGTNFTNSGVRSVATGSTNGTISVNTNGTSTNVAVKGLGSAAYTNSTDYDTKGSANTALNTAKGYTDAEIAKLLNNSSEAVDSIMELAAAMEDNQEVVDALKASIGKKSDVGHNHNDRYYTESEIDTKVNSLNSAINGKVSIVDGKGLSTNDYTTAEKNKLAGIASGAQVNQNAFSNIKVGSTTVSADSATDTLTLEAGSNVTITPDATNDKITISSKDTTYTSLKNPYALTIQGNGTTLTNGTYDGSAAKTVNITPSSIGAAASSHTHSYLPLRGGTMTGNINMGGKVVHRTPYLSFGNTSREYGQIKSDSAQTMYIYPSVGETNYGAFCGVRNSTWNFSPITHDRLTLGSSSYRWNCLFANNGTIQTSDRNAKHDIKELTDTHLKFFLKLTPVSFKFNDGTSGRTHIGFISQDIEEAMTECGLTDLDFAGFCKDQKTVMIEQDDGTYKEEYTGEYIYSLRYDEFIGLVTQATQVALNKIELLEEKIDDLESWKASVEERLSMLEL